MNDNLRAKKNLFYMIIYLIIFTLVWFNFFLSFTCYLFCLFPFIFIVRMRLFYIIYLNFSLILILKILNFESFKNTLAYIPVLSPGGSRLRCATLSPEIIPVNVILE